MKTEPIELSKKEPVLAVNHMVDWIDQGKDVTSDICYKWLKIAFREGQSNPKIKQLEWEHGLYNRLLSKTLVGDYTIAPMKDGYDMYLYSKNQYYWLKDYMNTIDEAKQFAQTDFENRVKECLIID